MKKVLIIAVIAAAFSIAGEADVAMVSRKITAQESEAAKDGGSRI